MRVGKIDEAANMLTPKWTSLPGTKQSRKKDKTGEVFSVRPVIKSKVDFMIKFLPAATAVFISLNANAANDICELLKNEKYTPYSENNPPSMYLIDKDGKISKGPVDLGKYPYKYDSNRFMITISTDYRLVVFPGKIILTRSGEGEPGFLALLKPTKSVCPNSRTYTITYQEREMRDEESARDFIGKMPYSLNDKFEHPDFKDPTLEIDELVEPICRFDCRFVGTIVDADKK